MKHEPWSRDVRCSASHFLALEDFAKDAKESEEWMSTGVVEQVMFSDHKHCFAQLRFKLTLREG